LIHHQARWHLMQLWVILLHVPTLLHLHRHTYGNSHLRRHLRWVTETWAQYQDSRLTHCIRLQMFATCPHCMSSAWRLKSALTLKVIFFFYLKLNWVYLQLYLIGWSEIVGPSIETESTSAIATASNRPSRCLVSEPSGTPRAA
jgi:hypothetical protein